MELVDAQTGELCQTHVNDSLRLQLIEVEACFKVALGIRRGLRVADDMYYLINIIDGNNQTFEDVGTFLRFSQVVFGTTDGYIMTVFYKVVHTFLQ